MNISAFLSAIALVASLPLGVSAATINKDIFSLNVSLDQDSVGFTGLTAKDVSSGSIGTVDNFEVSWFDGDTFVVRAGSGSTIAGLSFELLGLDFWKGKLPASIVGVTYDPIASDLRGYVGYSSIQGPTVSFTDHSILVTLDLLPDRAFPESEFIDEFGPDPVNIAADFVPFYFNVAARASSGGLAPVPLPAGGALLGAALIALAARRRR